MDYNPIEVQSKVNLALARVESLRERKKNNEVILSNIISQKELLDKTNEFLSAFAEWSREKIKIKLEYLANSSLAAVFPDKHMEFKLIAKRTKLGLQYDLYIETDGVITPLHDAKGGGVLDIISLALRISYLRMFESKLDQVLILDEPFKNLDVERIELASEWISKISKELNIQIIMVTHIPELTNKSDKVFKVHLENGISKVEII